MEIKGFENYLIFRNGAVLSKGNKFNKPKFLKPWISTQGYKGYNLYCDGKLKRKYIHRLLCEHFKPNIENKTFIDHINRNRLDNRLQNLRWVTILENNINRSLRKDNKTGIQNIIWDKSRKKFRVESKYYNIPSKRFNNLEDAKVYLSSFKT